MNPNILIETLKKNKNLLLLFIIATGVNLSVFILYHIMIEAFLYAELIIFSFMILMLIVDCVCTTRKKAFLNTLKLSMENENYTLPSPESFEEVRYQEIISSLIRKINQTNLDSIKEKKDMQDWYTLWVHQIKTPIAVMKLQLSPEERELSDQLFRIEEYADMALSYIRLGSEQNDLVIKEYALDELIRETLRKYAAQFIAGKIRLHYPQTDITVITDKKWLSCILEQYISNAVKYSKGGSVMIRMNGDTLTVSDTGIGISSNDLPRIFEKGYTGLNGRTDANSSGLGLYLCKKAAELLDVTLSVTSTPGKGSSFSIKFHEHQIKATME